MKLIRRWQYSYANTPTIMLKMLSECPVEVQSLQQKEKKRENRKAKKTCACQSQNVLNGDASGKKGKLSCCKCLLDRLKLIWPIFGLKIFTMFTGWTWLGGGEGGNGVEIFAVASCYRNRDSLRPDEPLCHLPSVIVEGRRWLVMATMSSIEH